MVAVRSRVFASDEELGKRNDDYKNSKMSPWKARHRPSWTAKRILGIAAACLCVWLFVHYIPTDLGPKDANRRPRYNRNPPAQQRQPRTGNTRPEFKYTQEQIREAPPEPAPPPRHQPDPPMSDGPVYNYDGPVKFYSLAVSLHAVANIVDLRPGNRHVLFAASDLNSLSALMPTACEMANWKRNHVHVAVMGRDEMPIDDIQKINGANFRDCPVYFHDARPDAASISTGPRMQLSVSGALGHINTYMQPRAVITVDAEHENTFFSVGIARTAKSLGLTHISMPKDAPQRLSWLARLDAGSLNAWYTASFDVLVQAPLESAGTLIRLLSSMEKADYAGFTPPRLIVELPHDIGTPTQNFLTRFKWPPFGTTGYGHTDRLLIRRRISEQHIPVEEASRRFIESFYPTSPRGPHVLILSSQAELSPAYFHYLKLHLLEFRHSYDRPQPYRDLFGISLETPSFHLNASGEFVIPRVWERSEHEHPDEEPPVFEPFLWEAPNSNAALYFSDKWIELHSFLTKRKTASLHPKTEEHHSKRPQRVSQKYPAWMEYTLDLMRLRGYYFHYPGVFSRRSASSFSSSSSFSTAEESLVIIHNELYHAPEEFAHPVLPGAVTSTAAARLASETTVLEVESDYLTSHHPAEGFSKTLNDERPLVFHLEPILPSLELILHDDPLNPTEPANSPLPPLHEMALLDYTGDEVELQHLAETALYLRRGYRHYAGGCTEEASQVDARELGSAADLFCFDPDDSIDTSMLLPKAEAVEVRRNAVPPAAAKPAANADPPSTRIPGSGGAAGNIARVQDAAKYAETAKAGLAKKLEDKKKAYNWLPNLEAKKLQLTEEEKAWLTKHPQIEVQGQAQGQAQEQKRTAVDGANAATVAAMNAANDDDDDSIPRDAPPIDHADVKPGQSFEEKMALRDAAKKNSLSDRARARAADGAVAAAGVPRGGKGRVPVAGDEDPERLASDKLVLTAQDDMGILDSGDTDAGALGSEALKVLLDDSQSVRDTVGDLHAADVLEGEKRFVRDGGGGGGGARTGGGSDPALHVVGAAGGRPIHADAKPGDTWTDEEGNTWELGETTVHHEDGRHVT